MPQTVWQKETLVAHDLEFEKPIRNTCEIAQRMQTHA